jgi:hypothetical protein
MNQPLFPHFALTVADGQGLRRAQQIVTEHHYLHRPVDPRCRPMAYLVEHHAAPAESRVAALLMFGRPESTRCYDGVLTYGSIDDVRTGRAQFSRWEVLNLARIWVHPHYQRGGSFYSPTELPGFVDRRGVWRSTFITTLLDAVLHRVGYDYLMQHPPVDCSQPYVIRVVLSYCDRRTHRGAVYRAAGWTLSRTNERGIETWFTDRLSTLTAHLDANVRTAAEQSLRSRRIRARRAQLELPL